MNSIQLNKLRRLCKQIEENRLDVLTLHEKTDGRRRADKAKLRAASDLLHQATHKLELIIASNVK